MMKGIDWGTLYNRYKEADLDSKALEAEISALIMDDDVTNKKGIYPFVLTREERYLSVRAFSEAMKLQAYENQEGFCAKCGEHFKRSQMEADHVTPWSRGGKTNAENCQMLCRACNRRKSNK
jgi:5-methylcytosine-specific restriction endonuclease McrA